VQELRGFSLPAAVALLLAGGWQGACAQQPNIVGTWEWTRKSSVCSEQYTYRDDGTLRIRRGEELTENTYLMSWAQEPSGRYRLTIVTVKDDRGRDCEGSTADSSGQQSIVYVLFGQSRETMIQCGSPAGADCTGIMQRTAR
jgi:hypothetical protein